MSKFNLYFSRFLCAFIALLSSASLVSARDYPLKFQSNLEFKLSTQTKEGKKAESSSFANVVAKIGIAPIHVIKIPSYDSILEDATIKTPVSVFEHGAVNILYQEGDKLENFVVNVPVFALDEKGMPVSVDVSNLSLSGLSSGVTSGSTTMTAGHS